jgi:phosphoglycolate phosphatase
MKARFKNVVFDLDGTLVDSIPGITDSLQSAVSTIGLPLRVDDLRQHIGPPLREMLSRMWPGLDRDLLENLVSAFRGDYNQRGCLNAVLYPGLWDALVRLSQNSVQLFILTNKPLKPTLKILENLALNRFFQAVHSPDSPSDPFDSKSEGAVQVAARYALLPLETLMVGDSYEDQRAAEAAGFSFVRAGYGYGSFEVTPALRPWPVVDTPSMLAAFLNKNTDI